MKKFLLSLLFLCAMAAAGFPRIGALAATTDDLPQGCRGTLGEGQSMDNNYGILDNYGMLTNNYGLVSNIRRVDTYLVPLPASIFLITPPLLPRSQNEMSSPRPSQQPPSQR